MKLVFVALALTAVAFAAPRTNFLENDQVVPEELVSLAPLVILYGPYRC
jgi:hypothetical protein